MLIWADPFLDLAGKGLMRSPWGSKGGLGVRGFIQSLDVSELTIKKHLMDLSMVFFNFFLYGQVWKKSIDSSGNKSAFKLRKLPSLKVICFQVFQASRKLRWSARHAQWGKTQKKYFKLLLLLLL